MPPLTDSEDSEQDEDSENSDKDNGVRIEGRKQEVKSSHVTSKTKNIQ